MSTTFQKMAGISDGRECLFCWKKYSAEEEQEAYRAFEVVGAGTCVSLKRQLNQWFILRKLLTAELWWCEDRLIKGQGDFNDEGGGGGTCDWFGVCAECLNGVVTEAWRVHEQILRLEGKIGEIKEALKKTMVDKCARHLRNTRGRWLTKKEQIEMDIRRTLVPDIELKLGRASVKLEDEEVDLNGIDDFRDDPQGDARFVKNRPDDLWDPEEDFQTGNKRLTKSSPKTKHPTSKKLLNIHKKKILNTEKQRRVGRPRFHPNRPKRPQFPCHLCKAMPFPTSEDLQDHLQLHQERQQLKNGAEFPSTQEILDCPHCTFPARNPLELKVHIYKRHRITKWSAKVRYHCTLCPKARRTWREILQHMTGVHPNATKEEVNSLKDKYLKCSQCPFYGSVPKHLTVHLRQVHAQKAETTPHLQQEDCHRCTSCDMIFVTAKDLDNHVANTHLRPAQHICDICGVGFPHIISLEDHKVSHTKHLKRDWICDVCGVDFPRKRQLQNHSRKFHSAEAPESEKIYKCRHCDLTSPFNAVIRKHLQTHKQQGDHRCDQCGKMYMTGHALKRHLKINHGQSDEVVQCPHCHKTFISKDYLQDHIRRWCRLKALTTTTLN